MTILQPLIAPLYGGKTAHEMLASLTSQPDQSELRNRSGTGSNTDLALH